jgi:hypothetical protein
VGWSLLWQAKKTIDPGQSLAIAEVAVEQEAIPLTEADAPVPSLEARSKSPKPSKPHYLPVLVRPSGLAKNLEAGVATRANGSWLRLSLLVVLTGSLARKKIPRSIALAM